MRQSKIFEFRGKGYPELRGAPRVPVSMRVEKEHRDEPIGFGYARNLSEKGMAIDAEALIEGKANLRIGDELRMRFKLPKSDVVITAHGKIVRIDASSLAPRIALEFVNLPPDFLSEVSRFVLRSNEVD